MSKLDESHVRLTANVTKFVAAMHRAAEAAKAFANYWNDLTLTRLLNIQPCRKGDHEIVLPCPDCGAAI